MRKRSVFDEKDFGNRGSDELHILCPRRDKDCAGPAATCQPPFSVYISKMYMYFMKFF